MSWFDTKDGSRVENLSVKATAAELRELQMRAMQAVGHNNSPFLTSRINTGAKHATWDERICSVQGMAKEMREAYELSKASARSFATQNLELHIRSWINDEEGKFKLPDFVAKGFMECLEKLEVKINLSTQIRWNREIDMLSNTFIYTCRIDDQATHQAKRFNLPPELARKIDLLCKAEEYK